MMSATAGLQLWTADRGGSAGHRSPRRRCLGPAPRSRTEGLRPATAACPGCGNNRPLPRDGNGAADDRSRRLQLSAVWRTVGSDGEEIQRCQGGADRRGLAGRAPTRVS
jgi:hypothetical protein